MNSATTFILGGVTALVLVFAGPFVYEGADLLSVQLHSERVFSLLTEYQALLGKLESENANLLERLYKCDASAVFPANEPSHKIPLEGG